MAKRRKKVKKRRKATPHEIETRAQRKEIREVFRNVGFEKIFGVSDEQIDFKGRTGDFDDVFVYENIIIFAEYTVTASNIGTHLLKKKILFDKVLKYPQEFIEYLENKFETFKNQRDSNYESNECIVKIIYCSKHSISQSHKNNLPDIIYFDFPIVKYFKTTVKAIKFSGKYEMFDFLGIPFNEIGENFINSGNQTIIVNGFLLPENFSNFKKGHKIVSFYISPDVLLRTSYILRKQGWREGDGLYQRMIIASKIKSIRKYLLKEGRVFINNIIATLPETSKILDEDKNTIDYTKINKPTPVTIQIPDCFNSIGLIDGQHRVFAYFEDNESDEESKISKMRLKTNLLVTGLIYPNKIKKVERSQFEAKLFLEINSNQSNASSELKQTIALILDPFSTESIAKAVLNRLDQQNALENMFVKHFYDTKKIKTSSIVSFGLKPIVKLSGEDSFYFIWSNLNKEKLLASKSNDVLEEYLSYCVTELNIFFGAVKNSLPSNWWNTAKMHPEGKLNTAFVNGIIICLRMIIKNKHRTYNFKYYNSKLLELKKFDFGAFKSSQYSAMGNKLFEDYFS